VPLSETVVNIVLVFFRLQRQDPPTPESLKPVIDAWLEKYSESPLKDALRAYLERGFVELEVLPREGVPPLPLELMQYASKGEMEEQRLHQATHVVVVSGTDIHTPIRFGYWASLAAGRALARASGGVLVDASVPRWLLASTYEEPLPADGFVNVWDHVIIPMSVDDRGQLWLTTSGLKKFGLPELQILGAPPNLGESLMPVMNAMAYGLLRRVAEAGENEPPKELVLEPEIRLEEAWIEASLGKEPTPPNEGAQGWTMVGLQYEPGEDGSDAFLTLMPPAGFKGSQGEWLNGVLADLVGKQNTLRHVDHSMESMEAAHLQAMGELPQIRQRFQAGLPPGEQLLVKHGFPTGEPDHNEYMWLAVAQWTGDRLGCHLANEPHYRTDLRAGQYFELTEDQLYDWVLIKPDGEHYGGWTNRVVEQEGVR
jgi:hypothetical protein